MHVLWWVLDGVARYNVQLAEFCVFVVARRVSSASDSLLWKLLGAKTRLYWEGARTRACVQRMRVALNHTRASGLGASVATSFVASFLCSRVCALGFSLASCVSFVPFRMDIAHQIERFGLIAKRSATWLGGFGLGRKSAFVFAHWAQFCSSIRLQYSRVLLYQVCDALVFRRCNWVSPEGTNHDSTYSLPVQSMRSRNRSRRGRLTCVHIGLAWRPRDQRQGHTQEETSL